MSNFQNQINIGFSLDINYVPILINTIYSILQNNSSTIIFYIIVDDDNTSELIQFNLCKTEFLEYKFNIHFKTMELDDKISFENITRRENELRKEIDVIHYGQILFNKYFDITKILYLEPDQIVLNDLKSLFDTDMTNYGIAACPKKIINYSNHIHKFGIVKYKDIKYNNNIFYFNAGVTLLNFEYWNNNGLYDRFIEILTENKNSTDPLYYYYTQGVLNILFFNNYKQIDYKYNVTLSDVDKEPFFRNLVETINNEYAIDILHFNGRKIFNKNINIDIKDKCIELYKKYDIMNIL
jgi:lipopolysaccharide biosynthesis glycosyltransferase